MTSLSCVGPRRCATGAELAHALETVEVEGGHLAAGPCRASAARPGPVQPIARHQPGHRGEQARDTGQALIGFGGGQVDPHQGAGRPGPGFGEQRGGDGIPVQVRVAVGGQPGGEDGDLCADLGDPHRHIGGVRERGGEPPAPLVVIWCGWRLLPQRALLARRASRSADGARRSRHGRPRRRPGRAVRPFASRPASAASSAASECRPDSRAAIAHRLAASATPSAAAAPPAWRGAGHRRAVRGTRAAAGQGSRACCVSRSPPGPHPPFLCTGVPPAVPPGPSPFTAPPSRLARPCSSVQLAPRPFGSLMPGRLPHRWRRYRSARRRNLRPAPASCASPRRWHR